MKKINKNKRKIIVAMSGGVDSSVAAKLESDKNSETIGVFLHFWKDPDARMAENKCCSAKAFMDARRVCQKIGIKLYTMNFSRQFKKEIVDDFLKQYSTGKTPNPCVRCNKFVKLGLLIKRAQELGFDSVASGHYVRLKREIPNSKFKIPKIRLYRAKDKDKDQSYFLWALSQEQLAALEFPLGDYTKEEVRKIARKAKLPVASKADSQEICFIPGKSHNEFLKRYLKIKPGPIKTINGEKVGRHQGLPLYTIGQRRGVDIGGTGPYYVVRMNYKNSTLYVTRNANDPALYSNEFVIKKVNWISGIAPKLPLRCDVVIRYRHKPVTCRIVKKGKDYQVKLDKPQRAVTAGQSAVFYKGEEVLGGGIIKI